MQPCSCTEHCFADLLEVGSLLLSLLATLVAQITAPSPRSYGLHIRIMQHSCHKVLRISAAVSCVQFHDTLAPTLVAMCCTQVGQTLMLHYIPGCSGMTIPYSHAMVVTLLCMLVNTTLMWWPQRLQHRYNQQRKQVTLYMVYVLLLITKATRSHKFKILALARCISSCIAQ